MNENELFRLECLRSACSLNPPPREVVKLSRDFEVYLMGDQSQPVGTIPGACHGMPANTRDRYPEAIAA
jgi:hypothetical protein